MMQTLVPKGRANYEPNSLAEHGEDGGPRESEQGFRTVAINGERNDPSEKLRVRSETFADHYSQARLFYRSQAPIEQAHIASAFTFELSKVALEPVRLRMLGNLRNVDEDLAKRVAAGLAMELPAANKAAKAPIDMEPSDALSILKQGDPPMTGRKIAILFDEGSDKAAIDSLTSEVEAAGGTVFTVAPKVGGLKLKGGMMKAHGQLAGSPSVLFDAVAVILSPEAAARLAKDGAAVQFVMDAFGHVKTIGHDAGAKELLDKAGVEADAGIVGLDNFAKIAPKRHWDREPKVRTLA
jgi:catalase